MWKAIVVLALAAGGAGGGSAAFAADSADYIKVEVRGTIRSGMVAIGGETTGTVVTARGATWELDLGQVPDGPRRAKALDGRAVVVRGSLEVRPAVERRERVIVTVTSLEPVASGGIAPH